MVSTKATTICALVVLTLLPVAATAAVQCSVVAGPGEAEITVTVTVEAGDPDIDAVGVPLEENAVTLGGNCRSLFLPYSSCEWTAVQLVEGPSSVTGFFSQDGGETLQPCGPFDNGDGLPVELVELSIE